jgi:hypothetical protein
MVVPTSYSGLIRVTVKKIDSSLHLDAGPPPAHVCVVHLEVAWEPRFHPMFIETQPTSLVAQDDQKRNLDVPEGGQGRAFIRGGCATEVDVRLPAPPRTATALALLKGRLAVIGPSKMLNFTFDKLKQDDESRKQTQDGVTVTLTEVKATGEEDDRIWTLGVQVEYPEGGPQFESFQSTLVNNEVYLEKDKGETKERFKPNVGTDTNQLSDTKSLIHYRFRDLPDQKQRIGNIGDWKLVYQTPGRIVEVPIPFEFKDVPLP